MASRYADFHPDGKLKNKLVAGRAAWAGLPIPKTDSVPPRTSSSPPEKHAWSACDAACTDS